MKRALLIAAVALIGTTGCSDDDSISPVSPTTVRGPGGSIRTVAPFRGGAIYRPEIDPALIGLCYNPWCGCYNGCAGAPRPRAGFRR